MNTQGLVRSGNDRVCCGVAAGIAGYWNLDPWLVRSLFVLTTICCAGLGAILYLALWLILLEEPVRIDVSTF